MKPLSSSIYREVSLRQHLQPDYVNSHRHLQERYRQGPKLVLKHGEGFVNQSYGGGADSELIAQTPNPYISVLITPRPLKPVMNRS